MLGVLGVFASRRLKKLAKRSSISGKDKFDSLSVLAYSPLANQKIRGFLCDPVANLKFAYTTFAYTTKEQLR